MDKINLTDPADIIQKEMLDGGEIRHTLGDENVSINNLMAVGSRLAADVCANRFICQMIIPLDYKDRLVDNAHQLSILPEFLPRDEFDGLTGLIAQMAIYTWDKDYAVCHVPQFDLTWRIKVGDNHRLIKKEDAFLLTGPNKGFDLILPYHPQIGYAPPRLLLQWIEEGYESPKDALARFKMLTTKEKLEQLEYWERGKYNDSKMLGLVEGMFKPEELKLLGESSED